MSNFLISVVVVLLILGGPLTLYSAIKILSILLGSLKVRFAKVKGSEDIHLLVNWDEESFDLIEVNRVKVEFTELARQGRSKVFSFTFEDTKAKKKSFVIPMKLSQDVLDCFNDSGSSPKSLKNSYFNVEVETVDGETQQFKISKSKVQSMLQSPIEVDKSLELLPSLNPDAWSVLTRVFPWRKAKAEEEESAKDVKPTAEGGKAAAPNAPRAPVDFKVTKVWIEPGCIVCDACENEAPAVFWVKEDTCIVRDNAPLDDAASIKAAAEGCPVNVIKYDSVSMKATG
jgi:ferredoxin